MQFSHILLSATLIGLNALPSLAAEDAFKISVTNTGSTALECGASVAHWFSEEIGAINAGETLEFSFGYELETGLVYRRNTRDDKMAVERIWCGHTGASWATRQELPMPRNAGTPPDTLLLNCAASAQTTKCEAP